MNQSLKHTLVLATILLASGLIYLKLPTAYYCAYDDFLEVHRAAFEDTRQPSRVFTTTHFTSYKYRPLNRGINLLTYWAGNGAASYFRTRNVLCHLLNIALIYLLAWFLFRRVLISGTAALIFGLHPLVNQAVAGAVMTNTAAHSLFLFALVAFLISLKVRRKGRFIWLGLALLAGWLSLLTYEAAVVAYPLMFVYLGIRFLADREWPADRAYTAALTLGSLFFSGLYYLIHSRFVPYSAKSAVPGIGIMLKNAAMYVGALLLPVDSVLANSWFGTPLPSEVELSGKVAILWVVVLIGLGVSTLLAWSIMKARRKQLLDPSWPAQLFVAVAAVAVISPLLLFADKASETYMYLTVAFAAVLFASVLEQVLKPVTSRKGRIAFAVVVGVLCVSYASATWVRNSRVARCGTTAKQIVTTLQQDRLRDGLWFVWLAPVPGEPQSHRYGMYGWSGLDTVGESAVQDAAQLVNGNEMLAASVITPEALASGCKNSRDVCLSVHDNGKVDEVNPTAAGPR
jgi:hypothetical protein